MCPFYCVDWLTLTTPPGGTSAGVIAAAVVVPLLLILILVILLLFYCRYWKPKEEVYEPHKVRNVAVKS